MRPQPDQHPPVQRGGQQLAAVLTVVLGQVTAAAGERETDWSAGNDHYVLPSGAAAWPVRANAAKSRYPA